VRERCSTALVCSSSKTEFENDEPLTDPALRRFGLVAPINHVETLDHGQFREEVRLSCESKRGRARGRQGKRRSASKRLAQDSRSLPTAGGANITPPEVFEWLRPALTPMTAPCLQLERWHARFLGLPDLHVLQIWQLVGAHRLRHSCLARLTIAGRALLWPRGSLGWVDQSGL
jgi:hypothetical protein